MLFPCTIQHFVTTRHFIFLSAALLVVPAIAGEAGNKTNNGEVVLVNLPLKIEDAILSAAAGSGDGEEIRHSSNSPARGEESSNGKLTPDNSGEDIGYMGAGLLGAAIGAGLGATWGGTGTNYGSNTNFYPQGYNPVNYVGNLYAPPVGNPFAPGVGYQQIYPGYPLLTGYQPHRPDIIYRPPVPAYGDQNYFHADAKADSLAGFGGSYPGYYSELLAGTASSPVKVTPVGSTTSPTDSIGSSSGQKKQPTTGATSGYPIDWSAVAEAYYGSRIPSPSFRSEDVPATIFVSESYLPYFDDY